MLLERGPGDFLTNEDWHLPPWLEAVRPFLEGKSLGGVGAAPIELQARLGLTEAVHLFDVRSAPMLRLILHLVEQKSSLISQLVAMYQQETRNRPLNQGVTASTTALLRSKEYRQAVNEGNTAFQQLKAQPQNQIPQQWSPDWQFQLPEIIRILAMSNTSGTPFQAEFSSVVAQGVENRQFSVRKMDVLTALFSFIKENPSMATVYLSNILTTDLIVATSLPTWKERNNYLRDILLGGPKTIFHTFVTEKSNRVDAASISQQIGREIVTKQLPGATPPASFQLQIISSERPTS